MKMTAYIDAMSSISFQDTWNNIQLKNLNFLQPNQKCIDPDYEQIIERYHLRRMSRITKMAVACSMATLDMAHIEKPNAIVAASGLGCIDDSTNFLSKMIENKEEALSPTPFIQSTHNTMAAQIALILQCRGYNQTYTQDGHSFESALLDALMLLHEDESQKILLGACDELTPVSEGVMLRILSLDKTSDGLRKNKSKQELGKFGEGSAFFSLSKLDSDLQLATIKSLDMIANPTIKKLEFALEDCLSKSEINLNAIDLVLSGSYGLSSTNKLIEDFESEYLDSATIAYFKTFCGEYATSSAFALWLAASIIKSGALPNNLLKDPLAKSPQNILIINHFFGNYFTFIVVGK